MLVAVKKSARNGGLFTRLEKFLKAGVCFLKEHPRVYSLYLKIQFDRQVPFCQELLAAVFNRFLQTVAVLALDLTFNLHQALEETIHRCIWEPIDLLREGVVA